MMTRMALWGMALILLGCSAPKSEETVSEPKQEVAAYNTTGFIERVNPALDQIIPIDAKIEILAEGFDWTEGPLWLESENCLIFSDIPPNTVFRWDSLNGLSVYLKPSGYTDSVKRSGEVGSNGLILDHQNNLILCQHGDRRLAMMNADLGDPKPVYSTVVDGYEGKRLNSPNDATFAANGDLYFTDPPYGLEQGMDDPTKEIPFQGVYRMDTEGEVELLTDELTRPNGIAISPDQKYLYVANSDPQRAIWMKYPLNEEGSIGEGALFYDATEAVANHKGLPDGLKIHPNGTIFATGPGGVWIFDEAGTHLGTIRTGEATSNCALGQDNKYLYLTADMYLMRVALH